MGSQNPNQNNQLGNTVGIQEDPTTRAATEKFMALVAEVREQYLVAFLQQTGYSPEEVEMRYGVVFDDQGRAQGQITFVKKGDTRERVALNKICQDILAISDCESESEDYASISAKDFNELRELALKLQELYKVEG